MGRLDKLLDQRRYIGNIWQAVHLINKKLFHRFDVFSIELAITYDCNKNCPMCYSRDFPKHTQLTIKDIQKIIKKYNPVHINLTGGEPSLHPEIYNILRSIPKRIIVSMVTNGDPICYDKMLRYKDLGLNTIQLSYGSLYDRGKQLMNARQAKDMGLNVCLSVINIRKERDHIIEAIKIAEKEGYHVLFNLPGCGLQKEFDKEVYWKFRSRKVVREDNMFWNGYNLCPAGKQKIYITATKKVYPCDRVFQKVKPGLDYCKIPGLEVL